jgi:hypothetical protein
MITQRTVIASFDTRNHANQASKELLRAALGEIQMRILPPPSAARPGERVIISCILEGEHAQRAEEILGRYGHVDLANAQSGQQASFNQHEMQTRNWNTGDHANEWRSLPRYHETHHRPTQQWRRPQRTWMEEIPTRTLASALTALGIGLGLWWGVKQLGQGQRRDFRNQDWAPLTGGPRQLREEAGTGRQRLQEWDERRATQGFETPQTAHGVYDRGRGSQDTSQIMYDRTEGSGTDFTHERYQGSTTRAANFGQRADVGSR